MLAIAMRRLKKAEQRRIAKERMAILLAMIKRRPSYAQRYVELINRLSRRWKVPIPRQLLGRFCPVCYTYFRPGINCTIRIRAKRVIVRCACGAEMSGAKIFKVRGL